MTDCTAVCGNFRKTRQKAAITSSAAHFRDAIRKAKNHRRRAEHIRAAVELHVETLVEDGLPIPAEDIFIKLIEILA